MTLELTSNLRYTDTFTHLANRSRECDTLRHTIIDKMYSSKLTRSDVVFNPSDQGLKNVMVRIKNQRWHPHRFLDRSSESISTIPILITYMLDIKLCWSRTTVQNMILT